jgi:broad specificity phosphatase PhoE
VWLGYCRYPRGEPYSEYSRRVQLGYRYPRGESYLDLIARLDPLMCELESYTEPLMIVSHQVGRYGRGRAGPVY